MGWHYYLFLTSNAHLENHQCAGNVNHLLHCVTTYQVKKISRHQREKKNCAIEAIWEIATATDRRCLCCTWRDFDHFSTQCHTLLFVWKIYQGSVSPSCNKKKATNHKICQLFTIVTLLLFQNSSNMCWINSSNFLWMHSVLQMQISCINLSSQPYIKGKCNWKF